MGRGYGSAILALVELCLLVALTAQDTDAYAHRTYDSKGNVDHYVGNNEQSFQPTFVRRQTRDNVERLNEEALETDRLYSNGQLHGRAQRGTVKPQPRRFIGPRKQVPSEEEMQSDGKIVFPGQMSQDHQVPSCEGSTYCLTADNYPEDLVNKALQRDGNLKYLASEDTIPEVIIDNRFNSMDDVTVPLCVTTKHVIHPREGRTKDDQWKLIVNQSNFKQGILVEQCMNEGATCSTFGGLSEGYKTRCNQDFVYRQLVSILPNGTFVQENFKFASSCCCQVTFTPSAYTRIGVVTKEQRSQVSPAKTRRRK